MLSFVKTLLQAITQTGKASIAIHFHRPSVGFQFEVQSTLCVAEPSWSQDHNLQESVIAGWVCGGLLGAHCHLLGLKVKLQRFWCLLM